jgi:hypothetical protein
MVQEGTAWCSHGDGGGGGVFGWVGGGGGGTSAPCGVST